MSYAGTYGASETCNHGNYWRNCRWCVIDKYEREGVRDLGGVIHADNGAGWCVGHIEGLGDGRSTLKARHCPVLNTAEQLKENLLEDRTFEIAKARQRVTESHREYLAAKDALEALIAHE